MVTLNDPPTNYAEFWMSWRTAFLVGAGVLSASNFSIALILALILKKLK